MRKTLTLLLEGIRANLFGGPTDMLKCMLSKNKEECSRKGIFDPVRVRSLVFSFASPIDLSFFICSLRHILTTNCDSFCASFLFPLLASSCKRFRLRDRGIRGNEGPFADLHKMMSDFHLSSGYEPHGGPARLTFDQVFNTFQQLSNRVTKTFKQKQSYLRR